MKRPTQNLLVLASSIVASVTLATNVQAATILNSTTFDGTEATSDGNLTTTSPGYSNPGSATSFDTVNGWTWGSDWTGATGGPANGGVFAGLGTIRDQGIRVGSGLELVTGSGGGFNLGFGSSAHQLGLAQGFTVITGDLITITYDMTASLGGMYLYVDNGSGSYGFRDHAMVTGAVGNSYTFEATGTNIRIAVRGNDGTDSNGFLQSIQVTSVPEPSALGLIGLGGLALIRRRRSC